MTEVALIFTEREVQALLDVIYEHARDDGVPPDQILNPAHASPTLRAAIRKLQGVFE